QCQRKMKPAIMNRFLERTWLALLCTTAAGTCLAAPNSAPTADGLVIAVAANVSTPIVLHGSDPDGDPLTFSIVFTPEHGTLSGTAPNLTYTPVHDFLGPDSFTFKVSDKQFTSRAAFVSITVKPGIIVNNISVIEGNSGTTAATFTISK